MNTRKNTVTLLVVALMLGLCAGIACAEDTATPVERTSPSTDTIDATETLFDAVTTATINSFADGLKWSAGYLKSIDGDKQGAMAMASRTIYNAKAGKYVVPISADLFGTVGHDNMIGAGFSADLSQFIKIKAGVGYACGGYGWSWSICPVSFAF
jgi:hypothetical protein